MLELPNLYELIRVDNVRAHPRFVVDRHLEGEFHGQRVRVRNLSIGGFGLSHESQLRVGSRSRLDLEDPEFGEVVAFHLTIVWSRMAGERSEAGAILYHSGSRIDDELDTIGGKLGRLLRYYGKPESDSMEIKRINALTRLLRRISNDRKLVVDVEPRDLLVSFQALHEVNLMEPAQIQAIAREASEAMAGDARQDAWSREVLAAWKIAGNALAPKTIENARRILTEIHRYETVEH